MSKVLVPVLMFYPQILNKFRPNLWDIMRHGLGFKKENNRGFYDWIFYFSFEERNDRRWNAI